MKRGLARFGRRVENESEGLGGEWRTRVRDWEGVENESEGLGGEWRTRVRDWEGVENESEGLGGGVERK